MRLLQARISSSRSLLPFMAVCATLVWMGYGLLKDSLWPQFLMFIVTSWIVVELNNRNSLIRTYSRMVSASYIMLSLASCFLFPSLGGSLISLCVVGSLLALFHTYQDPNRVGSTYYSFLLLGIGSLADPFILPLVPIIWILMASSLSSMGIRALVASLLGLLTPYWLLAIWCFCSGSLPMLASYLSGLWVLEPLFGWDIPDLGRLVFLCFIVLLALIGIGHYVITRMDDKIRTRKLYVCLISLTLAIMVIMVIQPNHLDTMLRLLTITVSPLIAHFVALTNSKLTNVVFILLTLAAFSLTIYNLAS